MTADCRALGGDGVIAAHVDTGPFLGEEGTPTFHAQGTAVRAHSLDRAERPLVAGLDAPDFAALIQAGAGRSTSRSAGP